MSLPDEDRLAYYESAWHFEFSRSEQEAVLKDPTQHPYLTTVWDTDPCSTTWLATDVIAGVTLVDSFGESAMSLVCRGFSSHGDVLCIKFPNYDEHPPERWESLEKAIRNEAKILRRLADVDVKFGELPNFVSEGEIEARSRSCPYVIARYIFGLVPLDNFVSDSHRAELDLWKCTSKLLGEIHRRRVVHGDLHQGNLLINSFGRPTILDFGNSQFCSPLSLRLHVERRHFGPLVALHIDEVLSPHRPLSFAYDVFCLAELMRKRLGSYFQPADAISPGLLQNAPQGDGRAQQSARFYALIKKCTEPEPEYRLPNGGALALALSNLETGPAVDTRRTFTGNLRVLLRKHFAFAAIMLACIMFLISLSGGALLQLRHQRSLGLQQTLQAEKDQESLQKLREANRAALVSMQELIEGAAGRDQVLEDVSSSVRNHVGQRLIDLMNSDVLDFDSQVAALGLALQISSSVMELDGWETANSSTLAACNLAEQIQRTHGTNTPPAVLLDGIKGRAILARIHFEKGGLAGPNQEQAEQAEQQAQVAARQFLELPQENYLEPVLRRAYLETGFQVAWHALYPQHAEQWLKQKHGDLLWQVINRSLELVDSQSQPCLRQEASLRRLYGLAMHKGAFVGSSRFLHNQNFGELSQNEYHRVLKLLLNATWEEREISTREVRSIEASVKSVLGMSLTNHGRFQEAQNVLRDAFELRRATAADFPGSLNRQREFISTGWNYADAIFSEATAGSESSKLKEICEREIEIRRVVVDKCRQVLKRDRNKDSEEAFATNALRLANAYYFSAQNSLALETWHEIEATVGLNYLTFKKFNFDPLLGMVVLAKDSTKAKPYMQHLGAYLDGTLQILKAIEANPKNDTVKLRDTALGRKVLTDAIDSDEFEFVSGIDAWQQIKSLLERWAKL